MTKSTINKYMLIMLVIIFGSSTHLNTCKEWLLDSIRRLPTLYADWSI